MYGSSHRIGHASMLQDTCLMVTHTAAAAEPLSNPHPDHQTQRRLIPNGISPAPHFAALLRAALPPHRCPQVLVLPRQQQLHLAQGARQQPSVEGAARAGLRIGRRGPPHGQLVQPAGGGWLAAWGRGGLCCCVLYVWVSGWARRSPMDDWFSLQVRAKG